MNSESESGDKQPTDAESVPTASFGPGMVGIGEQIGRYKLLRILGEGGFGIVYLAEQQRPMKRQVALKIIKPGMDSAQVIGRFEAERQALALLDHPNVAHVHDAGTTQLGRPYFAMEYVKGVPITEHCDRQKLTIEERLKLFVKVCEAIQHAHQKGIIHRDIKPSNIQVCIQGEQAVPKVIDFGVAKALTQPLTERTLVTEQGQMLGTPEYISPEQAEMTNQDIDTRSDIYSLGVVLYELLTGTLPFESQTLRKGSLEQMREVIRESEPGTPSTRLSSLDAEASSKLANCRQSDAETLRRKLRGDLDWITLKAMEKDRTRRYQTAHALAEDIERHLNNEPVEASPPGMLYRVQKYIRRHQALVTGLAAVLLVLLMGIAGIVAFAVKAQRQAHIAKEVTRFLDEDLLGAVTLQQEMGQDVTVRSMLEAGGVKLKGRFTNQPLVEAFIRNSLGKIWVELGRYKDAEIHLKRAYELRRERLGRKDLQLLDSMSRLGRLYLIWGQYKEAEPLLVQAFESRHRVLGPDHADTLETHIWLGLVYAELSTPDSTRKAEELLEPAFESCNRLLGQQNPVTLEATYALAFLRIIQGRHDDAAPLLFGGWKTAKEALGEGHRLTFEFIGQGAWLMARDGQFEEAERHAQTLLETTRHLLDEEHPQTIGAKAGLAQIYSMQYKFEEAEPLLIESVELGRTVLGPGHVWNLFHRFLLSNVYVNLGRYEEAESLLREVLADGSPVFPDDSLIMRVAAGSMTNLYVLWDRADRLNAWCSEEVARLAQVDGGDVFSMASILNRLAWLQATYPSDAIRDGTRAIENAKEACKLSSSSRATFVDTLAAAYAEAGDFVAAVEKQKEAIRLATRQGDVPAHTDFERRLSLYESRRAFRESLLTGRARTRIAQEKYDVAEQELNALLESVRKHLGQTHPEARGCILAFVELYEAWGKPEKAEEWQAKLPQSDTSKE
ncbi:MAG: serine/threonine protein kinase [Planctomycetota bacterium]|jgi:non-specific serine/threonine protein kinase/serine/threonine-protein kinase